MFLILCLSSSLSAQEEAPEFDPDIDKPHKLIVQTGLSYRFLPSSRHQAYFSLERPITHYQQIGVEVHAFLPRINNASNFEQVRKGSFECAVVFKRFASGRFTGRKSGHYLGFDMRFGKKNMTLFLFDNISDPTQPRIDFNEKSVKILFRAGRQRSIGRAVIEWSLPLGFEKIYRNQGLSGSGSNKFVFNPALSLGFAF